MRLFEAIMEANHRAAEGDGNAGLRPADFAGELPVVALTCIDPRLNALFPGALGVPAEQFIWLRNAGNIITGPLSSTMRSLALACAVKGGREIAIIGHTDCQVCKTTTLKLMEAFQALGVERGALPPNLTEFFGLFASEQQNVIKAVEFVRHSPLVGPKIPVHGLMVDVASGRLEWVVNGYQALDLAAPPKAAVAGHVDESHDALKQMAGFHFGEMKFPEARIGDVAREARKVPSSPSEIPVAPPVKPLLKPPIPQMPKPKFPPRLGRR